MKRPFLGYGMGNVDAAVYEFSKNSIILKDKGILDSSHNLLLDIFIQTGIIGGTLFGFFIGTLLYKALLYKRDDLLLLFSFFLLRSLTNITSITIYVLFFIFVAEIVILDLKEKE
jgi:O-antigen ligase